MIINTLQAKSIELAIEFFYSGLTMAEFCRRKGIVFETFKTRYYKNLPARGFKFSSQSDVDKSLQLLKSAVITEAPIRGPSAPGAKKTLAELLVVKIQKNHELNYSKEVFKKTYKRLVLDLLEVFEKYGL